MNVAAEISLPLRILEAALFASQEPMTATQLQAYVGNDVDINSLLAELKMHYLARGVTLVESDAGWSFRTALDLAPVLRVLRKPRRKIPRVAAEVLAIIAYHQPITRAEIESIRGVETSKGAIDFLMELEWIRPGARRETPGRPLTWKTTPKFLDHFNLQSLRDLPGVEDLKAAGLLDARPVLDGIRIADDDLHQSLSDTLKSEPDADQDDIKTKIAI